MASEWTGAERAAWVGVALVIGLGLVLAYTRQAQEALDAPPAREADLASALAGLHARARSGSLELTDPERAASHLIDAGFPPGTPAPRLEPRAVLVGSAVARLASVEAGLVLYRTDGGDFSVVVLPSSTPLPDGAAVVKFGRPVRVARADRTALVFWTRGPWHFGLVGELPQRDLDALLELVFRAQGDD